MTLTLAVSLSIGKILLLMSFTNAFAFWLDRICFLKLHEEHSILLCDTRAAHI
jgi:hypothetical protein